MLSFNEERKKGQKIKSNKGELGTCWDFECSGF